jgi:ubiquinone biosynthesis accessory factor UbiK
MDKNNFFNDLQAKINQVLENSPAKDIEKNVKAMMTQGFAKLDLVTREEFDVQMQVLAKTRAKLDALEARVAELEARLPATPTTPPTASPQ